MKNKFSEEMSHRTDDQLIEIVTVFRDSYEPLAIKAAEYEFYRRNNDTEKVNELEREGFVQTTRASSIIRLVNFIIDVLAFLFLALILVVFIGVIYRPETPLAEELVTYISMAISYFGYYIYLEYRYGKTIGKFITKTRVVTVSGEPLTLTIIIIRNLCRLIPFDRLSFLFSRSGFHDLLSGTRVVNDE